MSATEEPIKAEAAATAAPTVEDTAATAAAAAASVVTATTDQTLVAAAAAAVAIEQPPVEGVAATAAPRMSVLSEVDGQGKRRFFPRVKHLIGNKEWEDFLTQVLQCIEEAGAPETAAASHKANNAWYKAFDLIYGGVAREYSIPTGKNRYHKFKDKILEVWVALEAQAPGENHCRDLAMEQYDRYKRAVHEAHKNGGAGGGSGVPGPPKLAKTAAGQSASSKLAAKRSYGSYVAGGASLGMGPVGLWKNLDEKATLESLPEELRKLVHLKQLSKEMAGGTANRAARKGIEDHAKQLDGAYLEALTKYLKEMGGSEAAVKTEESGGDVEMATATDDKPDAATAYANALAVAFLYRYSSTLHEQKLLAEAYAQQTALCVVFPASEEVAAEGAAAATTETTTTNDVAEQAAAAAVATMDDAALSVSI